ncbi:MAG: hypothetical protein JF597_44950 [Streptomyces sp.]|uniref:hypothetical protein n=1 Tax=Streptomyces sp. TaxID=1931 RepID=UPI0025E0E8C7|nr:hypothetical protein [Streptomyces sp.]MBW8800475.1 hypothetical protein [Streptomyces sp.]
MLAAAPLTHVSGGIALAVTHCGGTVVIPHRSELDTLLCTIEPRRGHITMIPPTDLYPIVGMRGFEHRRFPALWQISYGALPIRVERLKGSLELFGPVFRQGYGRTGAPMLITALTAAEHFAQLCPGGAGRADASRRRPRPARVAGRQA